MQNATITILDKECRALIYEGRTYVQPQFTGEFIGVVVRCTPTETGWDLLLLQELKTTHLLSISRIRCIQTVEEVDIKIVHTAPLQLLLKDLLGGHSFPQMTAGQLVRDLKRFPGIALHHGLSQCRFAVSVQIDVGGVKIGKSPREVQVCHLLRGFKIHFSILRLGQPQKTEAQFTKIQIHHLTPLFTTQHLSMP